MISGDLTNKQKLSLEERTAFLINFTGVQAQQVLSSQEEGISTRKLYKILANTIIDWHWLSHKDHVRFAFRGVGEIIWTPHKFGALGLVAPSIEYNSNIKLHCGLFPNIIDLFSSKEYAKWGYKEIKNVGDDRYIIFAPYLPFQLLEKSRVEPQERYFWSKLVEVYSKLNDRALDALASCRNKTATAHSLWIQLVNWKRHMGTAFDMLQQVNIVSMDNETKEAVRDHIEAARACVKQFFVKISYHNSIGDYVNQVKSITANTELHLDIPCLDEIPSNASAMGEKCEVFLQLSEYLSALHKVCGEFRKQIRIDQSIEPPDLMNLSKNLNILTKVLWPTHSLLDTKRWLIPFLQPNEREIAMLCLSLIEEVFGVFEARLGFSILRPTPHYKEFLLKHYPLPREHFTKGN